MQAFGCYICLAHLQVEAHFSATRSLESIIGGLHSINVAVYITNQLYDSTLQQHASWTLECNDGQPLAAVSARREGDHIAVTFLSAQVSIQGCHMVLLSASRIGITVQPGTLATCVRDLLHLCRRSNCHAKANVKLHIPRPL